MRKFNFNYIAHVRLFVGVCRNFFFCKIIIKNFTFLNLNLIIARVYFFLYIYIT